MQPSSPSVPLANLLRKTQARTQTAAALVRWQSWVRVAAAAAAVLCCADVPARLLAACWALTPICCPPATSAPSHPRLPAVFDLLQRGKKPPASRWRKGLLRFLQSGGVLLTSLVLTIMVRWLP